MTSRELVNPERLVEILNDEMATRGIGTDCRFAAVTQVERDETGCNWSADITRGESAAAPLCVQAADAVVKEVSQRYNVLG